MNSLSLNYISDSIKGTTHKQNQDNILVIDSENYFLSIVFDGVSSAANPKLATKHAIEFIKKKHSNYLGNLLIPELMHDCNKYLLEQEDTQLYTTYSLVFIDKHRSERAYLSYMGDTRVYEITPQYILQLSEDDKFAEYTHTITKCLGLEDYTINDFICKEINLNNSSMLLCTDGFYELMEDNLSDFFNIFTFKKTDTIKAKLYDKINQRNIDDSTYILIRSYVFD